MVSPYMQSAHQVHRRILIPMDGSEESEGAFQWYMNNLKRDGDYLYVAHIVEPPSLPSFSLKSGFGVPAEEWRDIIAQSGEKAKAMEEEMSIRANNYKLKIEFIAESHKKPGEALVDIAHRIDCDLIIIVTRCRSDVRRAFLGSVSDYVLHHCHLPVCIVPHDALSSAAAAPPDSAKKSA